MNDYRHGSHTVFSIHLHVVWITKYRHKVLRGAVAERVREVVREECRRQRVDILQGHISADHVHVLLSIPPQVTISRLIQQLKGKAPISCCGSLRRSGNATGDDTCGRGAIFAAAVATSPMR